MDSDGLAMCIRNYRTILWSPYEERFRDLHAYYIVTVPPVNLPGSCFNDGRSVPPFYEDRLCSENNISPQVGFDVLEVPALAPDETRVTRKQEVRQTNCNDELNDLSEAKPFGLKDSPHLQSKISTVYVDQKVKAEEPEDNRRKARTSSSFPCHVCNKVYAHHSSLTIHMRTHTGSKPHRCPYCQKAFSQSGNLKVHVRIHTNERPYSCSYCDKKFRQLSALRSHEYLHIRDEYM